MASFKYRAQTADGKIVSGTMSAVDEQDLHNRLKLKDMMNTGAAKRLAAEMDVPLRVCTFNRHPLEIIRPGNPPELLSTMPEKAAQMDKRLQIINSPIVKALIKRATLADASKRSGYPVSEIIQQMQKLIDEHERNA